MIQVAASPSYFRLILVIFLILLFNIELIEN